LESKEGRQQPQQKLSAGANQGKEQQKLTQAGRRSNAAWAVAPMHLHEAGIMAPYQNRKLQA
jgi:hypothetical protein